VKPDLGKTLIGISSWGDASLLSSGFYPAGVNTSEGRLTYYSSKFSLVESDASFHAIPWKKVVRTWIESTPRDFVFDVKAFSLFSGHPTPLLSIPRDLRDEAKSGAGRGDRLYFNHLSQPVMDQLWARFTQALAPLQESGKLGFVMFQYPPWFHPNDENYNYIVTCKAKLDRFRIAVEFRTPGWFGPDWQKMTLDLLRSEQITLVAVDEPQGLKSSIPPISEVTSPFSVVRFHGRNGENWEQKEDAAEGRYDYLYDAPELEEWIPKIRRLQEETSELHLIFKNKHLDHPVVNALQMRQLLNL
jgi:uncharacterized protein YecE (DUF72 family)